MFWSALIPKKYGPTISSHKAHQTVSFTVYTLEYYEPTKYGSFCKMVCPFNQKSVSVVNINRMWAQNQSRFGFFFLFWAHLPNLRIAGWSCNFNYGISRILKTHKISIKLRDDGHASCSRCTMAYRLIWVSLYATLHSSNEFFRTHSMTSLWMPVIVSCIPDLSN